MLLTRSYSKEGKGEGVGQDMMGKRKGTTVLCRQDKVSMQLMYTKGELYCQMSSTWSARDDERHCAVMSTDQPC